MTNEPFIDYYEILQVSPNAHADTIDRVFRFLAQRYHPDNHETGDPEQFKIVVRAHDVLRDPEKRAKFDLNYKAAMHNRWQLRKELYDDESPESDLMIQNRILLILYLNCRRDIANAGMGNNTPGNILDVPHESLDFHLWFLKEKHYIYRTENGQLSITVDGIEKALSIRDSEIKQRKIHFNELLEKK